MELAQLNQLQFDRFCDFIYRTSGIRIGENKRVLLSNRIRRRLPAGQDFDTYYRFLISPRGSAELGHFIDAITTNETFFFRTPPHFQWLETEYVSERVAAARTGARPRTLRLWSAGCATGAEPYSMAICLVEQAARLPDWTWTILATDISEEALASAREGVYRPRALEGVSPGQLRRFFEPKGPEGTRRVKSELRRAVEFESHNLLKPMAAEPFDCVFIRNVLIYFDTSSKRTVVRHLIDALAPGGYLVVGPSEGIYNMLEPLERVRPFLYRKPSAS